MRKISLLVISILLVLSITACGNQAATHTPTPFQPVESTDIPTQEPTEIPTLESIPGKVLISGIVTGIEGNNNYDAILLSNTGDTVLNLEGMKIVYRLKEDSERIKLVEWEMPTYIAPHGYYLLGEAGEDLGVIPDAIFDQPIAGSKGGLKLYDADTEVIDALGWGEEAPEGFFEGTAAPAMGRGQMLMRADGDTNNNATDFGLMDTVELFNSGNAAFLPEDFFASINVGAPAELTPGEEYTLTIDLETDSPASLRFPLPAKLELLSTPDGFELADGFISTENLETGVYEFRFKAPWTYTNILHHSIQVNSPDAIDVLQAPPVWSAVSGGSIPIATAKTLVGEVVTVEGTVIMHSGAVFAGAGNSKFYIQDETGGLQIWVDNGEGAIDIPLGAYVQAKGPLLIYQDAFEHAPKIEDVIILENPTEYSFIEPAEVSIQAIQTDIDELAGTLIKFSGIAARVEEMTYGYEIDLMDPDGRMANIYIDKQTGMNIENIETEKEYEVTALAEVYGSGLRLYPRIQEDIVEIYPPEVRMESTASQTIDEGGKFILTFYIYNHTSEEITDMVFRLPLENNEVILDTYVDLDIQEKEAIISGISVQGNGGMQMIEITGTSISSKEYISFTGYTLEADGETISGQPLNIFVDPVLPIWALQGSGFKSPYINQQVQTSGVVTGVFPGMDGFFLQEVDTDEDPATSSAIFINTGEDVPIPVEINDIVEISGTLKEAYQQTSVYVLDPQTDIIKTGTYTGEIAPVILEPPVDEEESDIYFESLECMLVAVTQAKAVAPTNRYAEFVLVGMDYAIDRLFRGQDNGMAITVDDGTSNTYDYQADLEYVIASGDFVSDLVGPLAFTYGEYKIEPLYSPDIQPAGIPLPQITAPEEGQISIMTWNVENLFDVQDPHPSSPERPGYKEYHRNLAKVAATIAAAGYPTVVGIQEVENIEILEDIAELLAEDGYEYQPVLIEGDDSRYIDVGYMVDLAEAEIVDTASYPGPDGLTSRHPLLLEIAVNGFDEHIYLLNNHFLSMSAGEAATEPRRTAQAAWNLEIINGILAENPEAQIVLMGDLNSYYDSLPVTTLIDGGLKHVFDLLEPEERYTYIYLGVSQVLDHILMTENLFEQIARVEVLHTNADYPPGVFEDVSPQRKSDHDPVVVTIQISE